MTQRDTSIRAQRDKKAEYNKRAYIKRQTKLAERGKIPMKLLHVNVPATHVNQMNRMASEALLAGRGPWRSLQEVARGLLALGFEAVKDQSDLMDDFLPQMRLEQQMMTVARQKQIAMSMLAMAKENISSLIDIKEDVAALQLYHTAMVQAHELPQTVWSKWLIQELKKAFPELERMSAAGKVKGVKLTGKKARREL